MKFTKSILLTIFLIMPCISNASEPVEDIKPTFKIVSLETEIKMEDKGRKYHSTRAIVEAEAKALQQILSAGKFPAPFSWHGGRIESSISSITGVVPESFGDDVNPSGRLFNYSVPSLSFSDLKEKPIPDYDMVLRYVDLAKVEYFFAITLADNKYVGNTEK